MKKILIIFIFVIFNFSSLASTLKMNLKKLEIMILKILKFLKLKIFIFLRLFMNGKKDLVGNYYPDKEC